MKRNAIGRGGVPEPQEGDLKKASLLREVPELRPCLWQKWAKRAGQAVAQHRDD